MALVREEPPVEFERPRMSIFEPVSFSSTLDSLLIRHRGEELRHEAGGRRRLGEGREEMTGNAAHREEGAVEAETMSSGVIILRTAMRTRIAAPAEWPTPRTA